ADFSTTTELINIFAYFLPASILIWRLIFKAQTMEIWAVKPGKKDLLAFIITFPCLLITGFFATIIGSYISGTAENITLNLPSTTTEWALLSITCLLSAYLEESYFRFYLLSKREEFNLNAASALALSVILFSICHIYEGPWGFLNAVISGTILGFVFLRYNSFHGIAIAHTMYNISVYIISKFTI
ncbi:CPBP family intramembrane glutamic endopeptidase, partial [Treponema sp. R6D11]